MTRRDFEAIAGYIRSLRAAFAPPSICSPKGLAVSVALARFDANVRDNIVPDLALTNPRFDRGRFLAACGVPAE